MVIKRCLESIKELEAAEEVRKKNAPTILPHSSSFNSSLALSTQVGLIHLHLGVIAHFSTPCVRHSIPFDAFVKASSLQSDMQEAR